MQPHAKLLSALCASTALAAMGLAAPAKAATLAALQDGRTIVWIDSEQRR